MEYFEYSEGVFVGICGGNVWGVSEAILERYFKKYLILIVGETLAVSDGRILNLLNPWKIIKEIDH